MKKYILNLNKIKKNILYTYINIILLLYIFYYCMYFVIMYLYIFILI